tara:strand:+ start:385 stop:2007 length:1623 start_codon:yes stop_codon:yes gene_type:complete
MGFWSDFLDAGKDVAEDAFDSVTDKLTSKEGLSALGKLGIGYLADKSGFTSPDVPKVGYQGKIPELQAVRERVPMQQAAEGEAPRRPGSAGRRYLSDVQFAKRPDAEPQSVAEAQAKAQAQALQLSKKQNPSQVPPTGMAQPQQLMAAGGVASAYNRRHNGYYLGGMTDGMADEVPASIDGKQEARLSDGEFVIPADVVSHLGNGNSDAGAQQLHGMMNNVRMERTGNPEKGKQIDPNKFMPTMAQGGGIAAYNYGGRIQKFQAGSDDPVTADTTANDTGVDTGTTTPFSPQDVGYESSLSNWAGDYVTDMLGQGKALGNQDYTAYEGPLSAGASDLQQKSFTGIGGLQAPTNMGVNAFTAADAKAGMNPYLMASLNPQLDEARRQSEIDRVANAGRMTQAGAFGGSRQALMDMENQRNLQTNLADITGKGYASAYDRAQEQFNKQQTARNQYGFDVLGGQATAGATQRGIEAEGMAADKAQFEEERLFPYKQVQYMQSLLQDLPITAQTTSYTQPSELSKMLESGEGLATLYDALFGGK